MPSQNGKAQPMTTLAQCRACLAPDPYLFLPMGDHPPAQAFIRSGDVAKDQPAFPLNTQVCLDSGLIQVADQIRSEEHTSELPSLMRISYAVFCLKKKTNTPHLTYHY